MAWSFRIGRLLGSELRVHATFFLLLLWIGVSAWGSGGPAAAALNITFILLLFACVLAHEFGHALMARRYGIRTPDITLLPIGGLARLERMPERPGQEIAVALAGPAVNVGIALVLWLAGFGPMTQATDLGGTLAGLMGGLLSVNILLVIFNMIPAFPMDGGRVLRGVLAIFLPRLRATRYAVRLGQGLAVLFAAYALWTGSFLLGLVALFVFFAGNAELTEMRARSRFDHLSVGDAMIGEFTHLSPEAPAGPAAELARSSPQDIFPVIGPDGRLGGFATPDALLRAPAAARVSEVMSPEAPSLPMSRPAVQLITLLDQYPAVGVTGPSGRLLGYVTRESAARLFRQRGG
ncbi:site-2 protease family protein [Roseivivax sp. GX 12232]|uniref:site-2 protease family protein n=1 Tax=Roseivivax sp. GX 12232 TaxID=2900547 RepID=UPI001E4A6FBF|nr:site-2 protease family protein [Roseivivax sp. GX 12232]MCE0504948.1 site-2 protease family protein [Roseivivax sp. GX 12232]